MASMMFIIFIVSVIRKYLHNLQIYVPKHLLNGPQSYFICEVKMALFKA